MFAVVPGMTSRLPSFDVFVTGTDLKEVKVSVPVIQADDRGRCHLEVPQTNILNAQRERMGLYLIFISDLICVGFVSRSKGVKSERLTGCICNSTQPPVVTKPQHTVSISQLRLSAAYKQVLTNDPENW